VKRIIQEDIRDISQIKEISLLEILVSILHTKVGNLLSINSLVEDIQVTNKTLTNWMEILEKVYYCYRVYPFANSAIKSIKKEPKLYLWDYTEVRDEGNKNENLIANHLLKWVHFLEDVYGYQITLQYLRDKEQREVDFVIVFEGKIQYLIEVKTSDTSISRSLLYFKEKLGVEKCFQIVFGDKEIDVEKSGVRVISASKFLAALV
jgi:uncharacterized protein